MERGRQEGESRGYKRGRQKGESKGRINSILQLLEETEPVPEKLKEEILSEEDEETLKEWLRLAAQAESVEDFIKRKRNVRSENSR